MTDTPHPLPIDARYAELLEQARAIQGVSLWKDAWRRLRKNRVAMASLGFLVLLSLLAFFTPLLPLQSPRKVNTGRQERPPSFASVADEAPLLDPDSTADDPYKEAFGDLNWFNRSLVWLRVKIFGNWQIPSLCGTDRLGRDVLSRLMWGARISLLVGLVGALVSLVIGVNWGAVAGYLGGAVNNVMMRLVDILYSIPFVFVVIFLVTILGEESIKARLAAWGINRIVIFFFAVGALYWLTMARVVRGQVVSLKNEQFIEAARTIGAGRARIILRHLAPNLLSIVIVYLTLTIPSVILFEAFLSFVGLGVESPDVSWGVLADDGVRAITPIQFQWWLVVFPGLALGLTLFALNFLGDGLRDALDPRLKNR